MAVAEMDAQRRKEEPFAVEIPVWDWFYEVDEGADESDDEGASSGDASVDGFDSDASGEGFVEAEVKSGMTTCERTMPEDSGATSRDNDTNTYEGPCQIEAQGAPVTSREGESESSGRVPDLDVSEIPRIDVTMAWHCKIDSLVPHFEGEEDDRYETMDLPVVEGSPAQIKSPVAEIFNFALETKYERIAESPPNITNLPTGYAEFPEGLDPRCDASLVSLFVDRRFEPFPAIGSLGTYEMGQVNVSGMWWTYLARCRSS